MNTRKHISISQINMYLRCSMQYYYRYIQGLKVQPKSALTLGSAIDTGLNHNYLQKIETHQDLKANEVEDVFSTEFESRKVDTLWQKDEDPAEIKDNGVKMIGAYHKQIAPTVQPIAVQKEIRIEFENFDYDALMYLDLIDDTKTIIDTKTTSKRYKSEDTIPDDHRRQLAFYGFGYRTQNQEPESGLRLDYLHKGTGCEPFQIPLTYSDEDLRYCHSLLGYVANAVQQKVFIPNRSSFLCSQKWCGYWELCAKDIGGRIKL